MSTGEIIAIVCASLILLTIFLYLIGDKNSSSTTNTFFLTQSFTALGGCLMSLCTASLGGK